MRLKRMAKSFAKIPTTFNKPISESLTKRNIGRLSTLLEDGYRANKLDRDFLFKLAETEKDLMVKRILIDYARKARKLG